MIPTRIGQQIEGCTFTGFNRIEHHVYAIIVAPRSTEKLVQLKTSLCTPPGSQSTINGLSNTCSLNTTEHPAAYYCSNLVVDDITDWYLPSKNEIELCYRYLKPTSVLNYSHIPERIDRLTITAANRPNTSSIPTGIQYTACSPGQTILLPFINGSEESFKDKWYWSSTETR